MIARNQDQRYKQYVRMVMGGFLLVISTACSRLSHKYKEACLDKLEEFVVSDPLSIQTIQIYSEDYDKMERLQEDNYH